MTECLRIAVHPASGIDLTNKKKQAMKAQFSILHNTENHQGAEPIFNDREIKKKLGRFFPIRPCRNKVVEGFMRNLFEEAA